MPAETFQTQFARWEQIAAEEALPREDSPGPLSAARAFAEGLMLGDEAAARSLLRSDRAGARSFWSVASFVRSRIEAGSIALEVPLPGGPLPFFVLCHGTIEFLDGLREHRPEAWD